MVGIVSTGWGKTSAFIYVLDGITELFMGDGSHDEGVGLEGSGWHMPLMMSCTSVKSLRWEKTKVPAIMLSLTWLAWAKGPHGTAMQNIMANMMPHPMNGNEKHWYKQQP